MRMWFLVAIVVTVRAPGALSSGYCSDNTFTTNTSWMQFTKEPVPLEYGFEDKFKSIHCCVKGYSSIEWFKDGVAYPWSAGVSNLILYPEAANQTLYTRRAARADSGDYTCRLSNETHVKTHTIRLEILEKPPDAPKTMFISRDHWVEKGGKLRLYCEALIGRSYLADARSDLCWKRVWPNGTESDLSDLQKEIKTAREDVKDIIGSYLLEETVTSEDYGTYMCVVHSNDVVSKNYVTVHYTKGSSDPRSVPWELLLSALAVVAFLLMLVAMFHRHCVPRAQLLARQAGALVRTGKHIAKVLEKEFDVLVCWTSVDGELVRGALLPTLSLKYKYRVHSLQISTQPDNWYNEMSSTAHRSRSVVVVLSPMQYTPQHLVTALRQLRALPVTPVVVLLQDLPDLKREAKECGESLVELVRRTRLVPWRHVHERAFWTSLRLALPLPPPHHSKQHHQHAAQMKPNSTECDDGKTSRSCSLTALV